VLYSDEVFAIQGAIFEVNRELGVGFLESVYQECLAIELSSRGILTCP
jgi:GxxExxY protein